MSTALARDTVIGITPFGAPDPELAAAVCHAGALGVLDLGNGDRAARESLARLASQVRSPYGVRIAPDCAITSAELSEAAGWLLHTVVLTGPTAWSVPAHLRVIVEVVDLAEALAAQETGAHGLIARGSESGGRIGDLSTFVLLQQLLDAPDVHLPVWACGGIGVHTAAAAVAAGAAGVVLDSQLALLAESSLRGESASRVRSMDGTETTVIDGQRALRWSQRVFDGPELAVGQDGFLAARFESQWGSTRRAITAVRSAISSVVLAAASPGAAAAWLGPQAALCDVLGTELPVAQGPMTRVSDLPGFAHAVAQAGGLPFVALALAGAEQTRQVLTDTGALLGDAPWGVGILGFAPEEVRSAQLAEVLEARPSHAIIAGGRPSQARLLEDAGIVTFLHVPSPGLLQQYLEDGARRFVFEGAECGGHVGPRHSFSLWEAQLAVIEDFLSAAKDAPRVDVLFAGGIHDERSAAMVAAMTAPLAGRGLAAGVLMGTAYLFTQEAVDCGAVQPAFQRQAISATGTELLTSAPGHVTRCLPSPFTTEFQDLSEQLRRDGVADRDAWEQLEQLNVGRLRIASKGVDRVDGSLAAVDEQEQLQRGMFMAGQVAVLRSATTTVSALHRAVSHGAAELLEARCAAFGLAEVPVLEPSAPLEIAVVGMACIFPQAPDLPSFWANVLGGVDAVTEVSSERWDPALYYSADGEPGTTPSKWGGFLSPVAFDPLSYGIPPTALGSIEPVQLLSLEVARRALVDAGYDAGGNGDGRSFDRSRASVIFGAEAGSDLSGAGVLGAVLPSYLGTVPAELAEQLPTITEDSFPGMLSNVISGRIANRLDLGGSNFTVDAACASSLAALDVACKELVSGTSDIALCGGADLHNGINDYLLFASVHALSSTGRSRPFDSSADGIALGEGVACVVLKRLEDATRDGDRIYAVVQGIGSASDGRSLGLTAPRPEGQRAALERAYAAAGIDPADVGLVEAHGTGTVVGDRTELSTLTTMFTAAGAAPQSCALGSVKSQIGHTKCAAGLAGLIKASLALHTGVKPPTLHMSAPNPAWDAATSPFVFHAEARPWSAPSCDRVAGVSAFGFGGTNFHAVLQAHDAPAPAQGLEQWPAELFTFRAQDRASVQRPLTEMLRLAETPGRPWRLRDLALAAARRSEVGRGTVQVAIVASDVDDLIGLLRRALEGEHDQARGLHLTELLTPPVGEIAFLFPGQGSQRLGMFAELFTAFPHLQRHLELGRDYADVLFAPAAFTQDARDAQRAAVVDTRIAQPSLGMAGLAAFDLLAMAGVHPDLAGGHSYGELVALCAAGSLAVADLPQLSHDRGRVILQAVSAGDDPGSMVAVAASASDVERVLAEHGLSGRVVAANLNAPRQTVISGPTTETAAALRFLQDAGFGVKALPVACAFHSPLVAGAGELFARELDERVLRAPELPVFANRTGGTYPLEPAAIKAELVAQIGSPVRFVDQVEAMYAAGARVFVEAGPGGVLSRLVSAILGDRPHRAIPLEKRRTGIPGFLDALAELAVAGVLVDTGRLVRGRTTTDAARATAPRTAGWTVDGQLVRTAAGDTVPGGLAPARMIKESVLSSQPESSSPQSAVDAMVSEFLRSSREMVAAQRDVLLTYLGAAGAAPVRVAAPAPVELVAATPLPVAVAVPAQASAPVADSATVLSVVIEVISERTGYPADMIEPDLDLESDLSIDSIKRTEIVGQLARRLAGDSADLTSMGDSEVEELSKARTAGAIATWLTSRLPAATGSAAPPAQVAAPALDSTDVLGVVIEVISERTGYPADMIEPDLDLESDLSIDSIKRTEIVGQLARRLAGDSADLTSMGDSEVEELSKARTASAIATWLTSRLGAPAAVDVVPAAPAPTAPAQQLVLGHAPVRLELEAAALPLVGSDASTLAGTRFLLLGDDGAGTAATLVAQLESHGAQALAHGATYALSPEDGPVDGVLLLDPLAETGPAVLPGCVPGLQAALAQPLRWLLAVRPLAAVDGRADGLRGLMRSLSREYPSTSVRVVELDGHQDVATTVVGELLAHDREPVVLHGRDGRQALVLVEKGLGVLGDTGAGPAGDGSAEAEALGLDRDAVVLLIGGARGITARFAATLASAGRCQLELFGRTPLPTADEDPITAAAQDRNALRAVLARQGVPLAQVDSRASELLAAREVNETLVELSALGAQPSYRSVDASDPDALRLAVKEVYAAHGRLDGVVFAAGVIDDKVFADKDVASFERVFRTKADGARTLLEALSALPEAPRFTVLFGSIAAALGNRGQSDYAAANDALQDQGARWAEASSQRALTVHWGPWAPAGSHGGMVSSELAQDYDRRGIKLIDPTAGTLALLRELAYGDTSVRAVVYTASGW